MSEILTREQVKEMAINAWMKYRVSHRSCETQCAAACQDIVKLAFHDDALRARLVEVEQERDLYKEVTYKVDYIANCRACHGRGVWRDRLSENEWGAPYPCPKCTAQVDLLQQQLAAATAREAKLRMALTQLSTAPDWSASLDRWDRGIPLNAEDAYRAAWERVRFTASEALTEAQPSGVVERAKEER